MTELEMVLLKPGDIVRNIHTGYSVVVIENVDGTPVAIRSIVLRQANAWDKVDHTGKQPIADKG